jgi:hypothetical protein
MGSSTHKVQAVLRFPTRVGNVGSRSQSILTAMTGNPSFPSPTPTLSVVQADLSAFLTAEAAVQTRTKGAVEARDEKLAVLVTDFEHLLAYVQTVADANPSQAQSLIESAGMSVRAVGAHPKAELTAKPGPVPGSVKLMAKAAAHRASYDWQYSSDQKTWVDAPETLQAKTVISGLTSGATYYFRSRALIKTGEGVWSVVVSAIPA